MITMTSRSRSYMVSSTIAGMYQYTTNFNMKTLKSTAAVTCHFSIVYISIVSFLLQLLWARGSVAHM